MAVDVTCLRIDNGDGTWTYDFTVWNYTSTPEPYAEIRVSKFGITESDEGTQEVPADWEDAGTWRHNDPFDGDNWYGESVGGQQDPDDLALRTVWSSTWNGRVGQGGKALNGFRITLAANVTEFVWQAYASGYANIAPSPPPGPSRQTEYGAWFSAEWPEHLLWSYWEYAWNGTVIPTDLE